jgi:hypothetical protein
MAIALPWYLGARRAGDEAAAIASLEAINSAQAIFKSVCGHERYAPDLPSLGIPMPTSGEAFLTSELTTGPEVWKSGYVIRMTGTPIEEATPTCNGALPAAGYAATADRMSGDGARFFGTNTSRAIYENVETFTGDMPESGAPSKGRELGSAGAGAQKP